MDFAQNGENESDHLENLSSADASCSSGSESESTQGNETPETRYLRRLRRQERLPLKLRAKGNILFQQKCYKDAITIWLQSIKESLKRSVRTPSVQLYQNQYLCRLNLAMAYLKLEDWAEAKAQAKLVLESRPNDIKALLRLLQAVERLQEWSECTEVLCQIEAVVQRAAESQKKQKEATTSGGTPKVSAVEGASTPEDPTSMESETDGPAVDLGSFSLKELKALVTQARERVQKNKLIYCENQEKMMRQLGAGFKRWGVSSSYPRDDSKVVQSAEVNPEVEAEFQNRCRCLKDGKSPVVRWRYKEEREKANRTAVNMNQEDELSTSQESGQVLEGATPSLSEDRVRDPLSEPGHITTVPLGAVSVMPVIPEGEPCNDNPHDSLWTTAYTAAALRKDKRPLILSLPLTVAYAIEKLCSRQLTKASGIKDAEDEKINSDSGQEDIEVYQDRLLRAILVRKELTIHVLGARGDVEMEGQWTAILKRVPELQKLRIVFIGFLDKDDRWSRSLREGVLSPPLTKTQNVHPGQTLTCWLYKGLYQLYLNENKGVLTDALHIFHPDVVVIPEPGLSKHFDTWLSVFNELLDSSTLTVFTGYSAVSFATHDAANLSAALRALGARWIFPLQPNPYALRVTPDSECPAMPLWVLPGSQPESYSGISAKHAVIGCVGGRKRGFLDKEKGVNVYDVESLRAQLSATCDVGQKGSAQYGTNLPDSESTGETP